MRSAERDLALAIEQQKAFLAEKARLIRQIQSSLIQRIPRLQSTGQSYDLLFPIFGETLQNAVISSEYSGTIKLEAAGCKWEGSTFLIAAVLDISSIDADIRQLSLELKPNNTCIMPILYRSTELSHVQLDDLKSVVLVGSLMSPRLNSQSSSLSIRYQLDDHWCFQSIPNSRFCSDDFLNKESVWHMIHSSTRLITTVVPECHLASCVNSMITYSAVVPSDVGSLSALPARLRGYVTCEDINSKNEVHTRVSSYSLGLLEEAKYAILLYKQSGHSGKRKATILQPTLPLSAQIDGSSPISSKRLKLSSDSVLLAESAAVSSSSIRRSLSSASYQASISTRHFNGTGTDSRDQQTTLSLPGESSLISKINVPSISRTAPISVKHHTQVGSHQNICSKTISLAQEISVVDDTVSRISTSVLTESPSNLPRESQTTKVLSLIPTSISPIAISSQDSVVSPAATPLAQRADDDDSSPDIVMNSDEENFDLCGSDSSLELL